MSDRHVSSVTFRSALVSLAAVFLATGPVSGQTPPCNPCVGIDVSDPAAVVDALAELAPLGEGQRLYVRWRHELGKPAAPPSDEALAAAGATPWITAVFTVPAPVIENAGTLEDQLGELVALVREAPAVEHFQIAWRPASGTRTTEGFAFLFKRASVAVTGSSPGTRVLPERVAPDPDAVRQLYEQEVAAYLDGVTVAPPAVPEDLDAVRRVVDDVDPGRPLVVDAHRLDPPAATAIATAAANASRGAVLTFFRVDHPTAETLAPLVVLARETAGDLAYDRYSVPRSDDARSWTFVRGEDLALRTVVRPATSGPTTLTFSDTTLQNPERVDLRTGEHSPLFDYRRTTEGLVITVTEPGPALLLALERPPLASLEGVEGVEEELTVETERMLPVEEILRRLQAFEDSQARDVSRYEALNTTHLRFQGGGASTFEATLEGPFFISHRDGYDWAWKTFYVNGVRWRGERLPEVPLIEPEKAAAPPIEILFTPEYRYTLRGVGTAQGRDCWVIDFEPRDEGSAETRNLYRGTVWVDREHFGRVKTHSLQLGLEGEVISNEETTYFTPLDEEGRPTEWDGQATWLPTRIVGQQLLNVLNSTLAVEKETVLTEIRLDEPGFDERRRQVLQSDLTMVRDTERGMRYLVKDDETGERRIKEGFDRSRLFLAGGVFWDDALDYPLPLLGVNYFSFDLKGTGNQTNVFFGGALLTADIAQPSLFGGPFDAGIDTFAIAVPFTDDLYRDGEEIEDEAVDVLPASLELDLGLPIGEFFRLGLTYDLDYFDFQRADDTAEDFVLPRDHLLHTLELEGRYSRRGWRLTVAGTWNERSEWEPWGRPGNEFDSETEDFLTWQARLAKNFYLDGFRRISAEVDFLGGEDLDRFSKYQFGFFGPTRIHGFSSSTVRAEEAWAAHLGYGFEIGEILRLEGIVDAALATDEESGLDDELLAGVGVAGSFIGPWDTLVQVDVGTPIEGPDDGVVLYLVFLKLFR